MEGTPREEAPAINDRIRITVTQDELAFIVVGLERLSERPAPFARRLVQPLWQRMQNRYDQHRNLHGRI